MANSYADDSITLSQVGSYFVGQYYHILRQQPEIVYQFYNDKSTMTRVDGDKSTTVTTVLQIHSLLTSLNFTTIEIKTINSLESLHGGILVMVSGHVKSKDFFGKRKFVQCVVLAPQENGYFVLNDIFQLLDEETIHQHQLPMQVEKIIDSHVSANHDNSEPPVSDYVLEEEAAEYLSSVHIDDTVDKYSLPEQARLDDLEVVELTDEVPFEEAPAPLQRSVDTSQESWGSVIEEPSSEPEKKTYASILRVSKAQAAYGSQNQPLPQKITPPVSESYHTPEPASIQPASFLQEAVPDTTDEGGFSHEEEGELKSVYVRNLPSTVSAFEIEQEFMNFGQLRPDGVFVRNRKDIGICYAFVEFEDMTGVQNAIKASPIQFVGRQVFIEERRANSNSSSRGRRGRGRGSYPTDSSRGRYGGRGSGRGSNQDGGDYIRPRGNGFYQRGSRPGS